jgi:hypothetical protein
LNEIKQDSADYVPLEESASLVAKLHEKGEGIRLLLEGI